MSKKEKTKSEATEKTQVSKEDKVAKGAVAVEPRPEPPRLRVRYKNEIIKSLTERFNYENIMQVPKVEKVIVSMGVGLAHTDEKLLDGAINDMTLITGQKPAIRTARKSISNFKVREGMKVGCMVTLRGDRMYDFLEKLFFVTLPRVRDFGGISPDQFDGRGNFSMGLKEQLVFPEIDYDKVDRIRGMNIAVVTTARTDEEGRALLAALGCPFREV